MCDGGRYAPPFSGRATGVLGAEEITTYFFHGVKESVEKNSLQEKGYKTFLEFTAAKPTDVKLIMGMVPVRKDFAGVKDIVRKDASTITILGRGGEKSGELMQIGDHQLVPDFMFTSRIFGVLGQQCYAISAGPAMWITALYLGITKSIWG